MLRNDFCSNKLRRKTSINTRRSQNQNKLIRNPYTQHYLTHENPTLNKTDHTLYT